MTNRELLTSDAIKFALDWLEENKVEIEPLKAALAAQVEHWEHGQQVPKRQREAIIETGLPCSASSHREAQVAQELVATGLTGPERRVRKRKRPDEMSGLSPFLPRHSDGKS